MKWFLLTESGNKAVITTQPELKAATEKAGAKTTKWADAKEIKEITKKALLSHFQQLDPKGWQYARERYEFHVLAVEEDFDETVLIIQIKPTDQPDQIEDERWIFKTPKDAIDAIPKDPKYGYRGMSWEEWQQINRKGYVKTRGVYNIGKQGDYTFFGRDPKSGHTYATAMAPFQYQPSSGKPGVVIAVPANLLKTQQDDPTNISSHELASPDKLDKSEISHAWIIKPASIKPVTLGLKIPWKADWDQREFKSKRSGFFVLDVENPMWMGGLNLRPKYSIKQIF